MEEETTQQQINISVFTPIIYLAILVSCLVAFSIIYRRRKVSKLSKVVPIFGENYSSEIYGFLKAQTEDPNIAKEQKPHDKVMKAALLRKGVECIRRSLKLKEAEPVYKQLYQNGLIGDDIYQQFTIQAKFQELELTEIATEAETYKKNWSHSFFQVAQQICFNEASRRRVKAISSRAEALAELWEMPGLQDVEKVSIEPVKETKTTGSEVSNTAVKKKNKKKA